MTARLDTSRHIGRRRFRRPGSVYLFVLMSAMLVAVVALAALRTAQVSGRIVAQDSDTVAAEALAQSAVEYGLSAIAADLNWRTDYPAQMRVGPISLGGGTISFSIVDDVDGNLTNNDYDSVRISGTGQVHDAVRIYSVHCTTHAAITSLQIPAAFGKSVTLSGMAIGGPSPIVISSNTNISASSVNFGVAATLQSTSVANVSINGCSGAATTIATGTRQLPDPVHVFDYYQSQATSISIANVPTDVNGIHIMQLGVLSPGSNPYGATTNPQGIYVINCSGAVLQIANMRIVGTLIVLNPGAGSGTAQSNYMAPATANFPALMVMGDWLLASTASNLTDNANTGDATTPAVNYNPPSTPYLGA
ncbi:MAG TPA: hypothetical protein VHS31_05195, partial [Tepidisphaeraceae bacterium]|nr:hypothetical protein [Tepidisphaeraceae bacterium]